MNIMVTGGAGFIGSHLSERLIQDGHRVVIVDNLSHGSLDNIPPKSIFYELDIRNEELKTVFEIEKPEVVIHHAAQVDVGFSQLNCLEDADVNIHGSLNLFNCAAGYCRKVIYASSAAVYGEPLSLPITEGHQTTPLSFYGLSKLTAENYLTLCAETYGFSFTILRYANVYGLRQPAQGENGVIAAFIECIIKGESPQITGNGEQTRDFVYVGDVIEANVKALERGAYKTINIGSGVPCSINQLFNILARETNFSRPAIYSQERKGDIKNSCFGIKNAYEHLGWMPRYSLHEGLQILLQAQKAERSGL